MFKIYALLLAFLSCSFADEADDETVYSFKSTYPEGFGKVFGRIVTIKKVPADPNWKFKGALDSYQVIFPGKDVEPVSLKFFTPSVEKALVKLLASKETIRVKVAAYETIQSRGSPGLSSSAPDREKMDYEIPTNVGWQVEKVIVLMAFEPVISDQ